MYYCPLMRHVVSILLWGLALTQNIYLSQVNKNNNNGMMLLKLDSDNLPQTVYIMCNPTDDTLATDKWKRCREFKMNGYKADVIMSSYNLERGKYYAFMIDDNENHYTKPIYLDRNGMWCDPATDGDKIAADKQRDSNGIADIFGENMSITAVNLLISHMLFV